MYIVCSYTVVILLPTQTIPRTSEQDSSRASWNHGYDYIYKEKEGKI